MANGGIFNIFINKGKKSKAFLSDQIVGDSGTYTQSVKVVAETELDESSYPYTFTIVPSTFNKGEE